jgi:hypothetical protein
MNKFRLSLFLLFVGIKTRNFEKSLLVLTNRSVSLLVAYAVRHVIYYKNTDHQQAVRWLRRLAAGLSPRWPGFDPGSAHVGFVVDKVALGQVFPRVLRISPVISFHRCSITRKRTKNNNHHHHLHHRVAQ